MTIYFLNQSPFSNETGVLEDTSISFDVTSTIPLVQSSLKVRIDGVLAYNGSSFLYPFNLSGSAISDINIDGYDGYNVTIYNVSDYDNFVDVQVEVQDTSLNDGYDFWSFLVEDEINTLYFCDGYGVKKANVRDLVGESQSIVRTFLSTSSIPSIPHNSVASLHGNQLDDGYFYLAMSYNNFNTPDGYGVYVVRNEVDLDFYSDGYACYKGQITDDGKLYLINKDENQIEVYYGLAELFSGAARPPDFIYSSTSTPAIMAGEILTLHVVSGVSTRYSGGTRLYVGTENGLNRIECYDRKNIDGTPYGSDNLGISYSYSLASGSGTYKSIGGTISRVTSISSDEDNNIFMAVTQDGAGNGGVTQISLLTNRKVVFMTYEMGALPSNEIRDIFGIGGN